MNIQTPWIFFPSGVPPTLNHPQAHHHMGALNKGVVGVPSGAMGGQLIPLNYPPQLVPHSLQPPPGAGNLGTFNVPSHHLQSSVPHPHQHSQQQLLLAAAAAYEQQCSNAVAATRFLHQSQQQQQQHILLPNGFHQMDHVHQVGFLFTVSR